MQGCRRGQGSCRDVRRYSNVPSPRMPSEVSPGYLDHPHHVVGVELVLHHPGCQRVPLPLLATVYGDPGGVMGTRETVKHRDNGPQMEVLGGKGAQERW